MIKKIVVPIGMLKAAEDAVTSDPSSNGIYLAVEAALRWLDGELASMSIDPRFSGHHWDGYSMAIADVRRMFLAPEMEYIGGEEIGQFCARYQRIDEAVLEAYRRGKESK